MCHQLTSRAEIQDLCTILKTQVAYIRNLFKNNQTLPSSEETKKIQLYEITNVKNRKKNIAAWLVRHTSSTYVNFTRVNKIEVMYGRSHVNVKVSYAWPLKRCLCFIYASKFYVRSHWKIARQWKSTLGKSTCTRAHAKATKTNRYLLLTFWANEPAHGFRIRV